MNKEQQIRIAVIGAGQMAEKVHLPILQKLSKEGLCRLHVLCDIQPERVRTLEKRFKFDNATTDAGEVARRDVDVVYIFGTAQMHERYGLQALNAGKHLFVEKPPASSWHAALQMHRIAKAHKLKTAVGFNRRFHSAVRYLRTNVERGVQPRSLEATFHKPAGELAPPYGTTSWLMANGIHAVDTLLYLKGEMPEFLYSACGGIRRPEPQAFSVLLVWADGVHATLMSNNAAGSRNERYSMHAKDVSYSVENDTLLVNGTTGKIEDQSDPKGFEAEHRAFLDAIQGRKENSRASLHSGAAALRLVELMEQGFRGRIEWGELADDQKPANKVQASNTHHLLPESHARKGGAILVLNPEKIGTLVSVLAEQYRVISHDNVSEENDDVVAVITGQGRTISDELLQKLPKLCVVGIIGASLKKYNPREILRRGIPIINASDIYADTVAEFVVMLAILGVRKASRSHEVMRRGGWGTDQGSRAVALRKLIKRWLRSRSLGHLIYRAKPLSLLLPGRGTQKISDAHDFRGSSIGLIGYGNITQKMIALLKSHNCKVSVYSDHLSAEKAQELDVSKADLSEVMSCRVVSVHRGFSDRTRGSIGKQELQLLQPGSVFINTARGQIVDENALIQRLERGDVFACLDVFTQEPLARFSRLRTLPNVFLTPHLSGGTQEMHSRAAEAVVLRTLRFLSGGYNGPIIDTESRIATMT